MRLIDADALIGELHTQFFYDGRDRTRIYAKIQEQPTIESERKKDVPDANVGDMISRQAALKKLAIYIHLVDKTMGKGLLTDADCMEAAKSVLGEDEIPAVQPATSCSEIPNGSDDTISRQVAIDAMKDMYRAAEKWLRDTTDDVTKARAESCMASLVEIKLRTEKLPVAQPEPHWIPCSERLPEDDVDVLISYRYKEGEGDTSHTDIDITTYGQMYFGGNKVGNYKHWRAPFEYFESNYEVIAWMPLPKPYRGGEK